MIGHALAEQPGDSMRDDPRLATSRPGQNQQRPLAVLHRFLLREIQVFKQMLQATPSVGAGRFASAETFALRT